MSFTLKPSALASQASKLEYYTKSSEQDSAAKHRVGEAGFSFASTSSVSGDGKAATAEPNPFSFSVTPAANGTVSSTAPTGACEAKVEACPGAGEGAASDRGEAPESLPGPSTATSQSPAIRPTSGFASSFVFGQMLTERVATFGETGKADAGPVGGADEETKGMLFTAALKETGKRGFEATGIGNDGVSNSSSSAAEENGQKSLSESAAEYEKSTSLKRKLDDVEVTTGEEGETNVFHVLGKLFRFDPIQKNWQEKGTGQIRVNDTLLPNKSEVTSRIVVRTQGSLRLILNSKLYPGMVLERASSNSIKITAVDSEDTGMVRLFLMKCRSPNDAENLDLVLGERLAKLAFEVDDAGCSEARPSTTSTSFKKTRRDSKSDSEPDNLPDLITGSPSEATVEEHPSAGSISDEPKSWNSADKLHESTVDSSSDS